MKVFIPDSVRRVARKRGVELSTGLVTIVAPDPRIDLPLPYGRSFEDWLDEESTKYEHICDDYEGPSDERGSPSEWCPCCEFRSDMQWRHSTRQTLLRPPPPPPPPQAAAGPNLRWFETQQFKTWFSAQSDTCKEILSSGLPEARWLAEDLYLGTARSTISWSDRLDRADPGWEAKLHAQKPGYQLEAEERAAEIAAADPATLPHPHFGATLHDWLAGRRGKTTAKEREAEFQRWLDTKKGVRPIWCGVDKKQRPGVTSAPTSSVRITNIPDNIQLWDVREMFSNWPVRDVFRPVDTATGVKRPFVFVELLGPNDAVEAVNKLSDSVCYLHEHVLRFAVADKSNTARKKA
jgi:hypothetical protein